MFSFVFLFQVRPHSAAASSIDLVKALELQNKYKDYIDYEFVVATGPHKHAGTNSKVLIGQFVKI